MINILYLHAGAEMYGADKVMLDLIKNLDRSVFSPHVILPCDGILVKALKDNNIDVEIIPYPIMRRKYFNPKGIIEFGISLFYYSRLLAKKAREYKIDIVHTNTAATLEGCFIRRKLHIPQLWSIHEIIVSPTIMFSLTSRWISRNASITVTDSQAVKNHLLTSGKFKPDDIHVIYNGVDSNRFSPENDCSYLYKEWNIPEDAKVIGMIGRVNSWKGQKDFLKAANIIMSKCANVYTVFVGAAFQGEEWREKELAEEIEKSPYRDRIINKGYRNDSEGIYRLFDVFVLPSTNPDPLPTVVLEAMSSGRPVVGYRHGGICEMVLDGENGLLANIGDSNDLAEKILEILNDDELQRKMCKASRKRLLDNFSMDSYIQNYSNEYINLMHKG